MKKSLSRFIYWAVVLFMSVTFLISCNEDEFETPEIPNDTGYVNLYLSTLEWPQDSISSAAVIIQNLSMTGENGESFSISSEELTPVNLLDSGAYLGLHNIDSGLYTNICFEVSIKLLPEQYKNLDKEFSEDFSFLENTSDSLIQLYSHETYFCKSDTISIQGGRETTMLFNFDPENSFEIDTVYNKAIVCHIPPGNPQNRKTLKIGKPAVPAHLGHGDFEGSCSEDDEVFFTPDDYDLVYKFDPEFDFTIPLGTIEGVFPQARRFRNLRMFVYEEDEFSEIEFNTEFSNAVLEFELDRDGAFELDLLPGRYDFYAIDIDRRGNYETVGQAKNKEIIPLETTTVIITELR